MGEPPSPCVGIRMTMHTTSREGLRHVKKRNDEAKAPEAWMLRLMPLGRSRPAWLEIVQVSHGALGVGGRGEDGALVVGQHLQ